MFSRVRWSHWWWQLITTETIIWNKIPEGSYDLIDIAETIKNSMKRNGHDDESIKISANTNTLKSILEIKHGAKVDFSERNALASVLDFRNQLYSEEFHESENVVNILSIIQFLCVWTCVEEPCLKWGAQVDVKKKLYQILWFELATVTSQALNYDVITYTLYEGLNYTTETYPWTTCNSNRLLQGRPRSSASFGLIIRFILTDWIKPFDACVTEISICFHSGWHYRWPVTLCYVPINEKFLC